MSLTFVSLGYKDLRGSEMIKVTQMSYRDILLLLGTLFGISFVFSLLFVWFDNGMTLTGSHVTAFFLTGERGIVWEDWETIRSWSLSGDVFEIHV